MHTEDCSLASRCCLHFRIFSNPHVSNMVLVMMMMTGRPLPSPFTYRCVWQLAPPSAGHITWAPTGARVTSTKSHVDLHLPSAGDQLSELDHYGRWNCCSFTRDLLAVLLALQNLSPAFVKKNDGGFLIISSNHCHGQFSHIEVFLEAPCNELL